MWKPFRPGRLPSRIGAVAGAVLLGACSASKSCYLSESASAQDRRAIYVVRRAQHTGIAVRKADWPDPHWAVLEDFPHARYLEFGWGDAVYYQAEKKTLRMTLGAVLWPSPSVMQVVGFTEIPEPASAEFVEVAVSDGGLRALAASIRSSFAGETPQPTGAVRHVGTYRVRFYRARGNFYFPRMCNRWTAERLAAAGCPLRTSTVVLAGRVVREARRFAEADAASVHSWR